MQARRIPFNAARRVRLAKVAATSLPKYSAVAQALAHLLHSVTTVCIYSAAAASLLLHAPQTSPSTP
jgi:hypothetical protein